MSPNKTGPTPERLALADRAIQLRKDGRLYREIQAELGISYTYAQQLVTDPDGSQARARKDSYAQPCPKCGKLMTGSDGLAEIPSQCVDCAHREEHENRYWTRQRVLASLVAFKTQMGRTPAATDVIGRMPSMSRRLSATRLAELDISPPLPPLLVINREFGSWSQALAAAGMEPGPTGGAAHRERATLSQPAQELVDLLASGPRAPAELARATGKDNRTVAALCRRLVRRGTLKRTGPYIHLPEHKPPTTERKRLMAREFVVLHKNGDGYEEIATLEAVTSDRAIEDAATSPGEYVAIPAQHFVVRPVGKVERLAVLEK